MTPVGWFYAQENQKFGPISAAELKALADAGKLRPEDLVWREGMDAWVPARRVKGLFEGESATASGQAVSPSGSSEVSAVPSQTPRSAANQMNVFLPSAGAREDFGRGFENSLSAFYRAKEGTSVHLFDLLLDLLRRTFPATLVEATCQTFSLVGYYSLYGAMVLLLLSGLLQTLEAKDVSFVAWSLVGVLALVVLQYTAGRFLTASNRLNKSSPGRICSTVFLDCLALLLLAVGAGSALGLVLYAVQESQYLMILLAVESFIVMELAALIAIAPETVQITISPETRAGEEALGVGAFLLKLVLKLTPVLCGLGVLHGTAELLYGLILLITKKPALSSVLGSAFWHLAGAAALPLLVYLGFLSGYLSIDLMRAVLELPRLLQKNLPSADQQPSEED